jgi:hypothetical protein
MELILTKNNFDFNGDHFLQVGGTAMGTKMAPSYAIKSLGLFEQMFVYTYHKQPLLWIRYIDDIFVFWQHGEEELFKFLHHLNTCSPTIKFTMEHSTEEINFLDTTVKITDGVISTDLFCKPTDSHNYLMYSSAHSRACRNSISFSQFLRVRRICSDILTFDEHIKEMGGHFLRRGYPCHIIEEAAIKARRLDRHSLLYPSASSKKRNDSIVLTTTFHPHDNTVKNTVDKNWDLLGKSSQTSFLQKSKLVTGFRRPQNLRDMLVRAKLSPKPQPQVPNLVINNSTDPNRTITSSSSTGDVPRTNRPLQASLSNASLISVPSSQKNVCKNKKCRYCPLIDKSGIFTCKVTGKTYNCMKNVSCKSSNLIYGITCNTCGLQYVGQTKRKLSLRFQGHFYKIKCNSKVDGVGAHFSSQDHNGTNDLKIQVLEFIRLPPDSGNALNLRLKIEKKWIHLLRCPAPYGINLTN